MPREPTAPSSVPQPPPPTPTGPPPGLPTFGDNGHFKAVTFRAAAVHLEKTRTKGGPKTQKSCETKYRALRKLWELVDFILGVSGWTWSDRYGVQVTPATQGTWDAWVAKHKQGKRFRNKGWPHYTDMKPLMPSKAKGSNVFRVATAAGPNDSGRSSSPPWDMSGLEGGEDGAGDDEDMDVDEDDDPPDAGGSVDGDADKEPAVPGAVTSSSSAAANTTPVAARTDAPSANGHTPARPSVVQKKAPRLSGGAQAITDLNATASKFNEIFARLIPDAAGGAPHASAPIPPAPSPLLSPERRTAAINLARQKEDWLDTAQRVALVQIVRDARNADVYLALADDEGMRITWVLEELQKVGVYAFHPTYSSFTL
ncbi:hypothetical protein R3P38DRAFT_3355986 [Favolaschia claudopus]|uniref:Myb/SANT-like domain-containing protein n=1 Tax=Favolaschia claudopus TaxID=2862362 RepID=A0AAW0BJL0_9AGAR